MNKFFISIAIIFSVLSAKAFDLFEPSIECTVIKVNKQVSAFGFKKFPKLYSGIFNQPNGNNLKISGESFKGIRPITKFKTEVFERIQIDIGEDVMLVELHGKPLSRNGNLLVNGVEVGKVTCH